MIVKKMPILQWFPDFETVKNMSVPWLPNQDFRPVFYDIETTGLSRNSTFLYLIGAVVHENGKWQMYQWFAERAQDEPLLLREFSNFLDSFTCTIQYNGNQFDQPYLEEHFRMHGMKSPFKQKEAFDLYRTLRPLKQLLKLPGMKQPQLEEFLSLPARLYCDGHDCIRLYKQYTKNHLPEHANELMGHNQEDLQGLGQVFSILSYLDLYNGRYQPCDACFDGEHLLMTLQLPHLIPVPFSNGTTSFYIKGEDNQIRLAIKAVSGKTKQYYPNYKDYHFIPSEDTAMPKSLSSCLDKSLRCPAKPETCYTWFDCSGAFLENPIQQFSFLKNTLPFLLNTLK